MKVALDDLADLVAPRQVIVCEGNPGTPLPGKNTDHDARCYTAIFGDERPDTIFVSGGNSHDVAADRLGFAAKLPAIVKGTSTRLLIDRDDHAPNDVEDYTHKGVTVLNRRNIESYLYDDEVLRALCLSEGEPEAIDEIIDAKKGLLAESSGMRDDLKSIAGQLFTIIRNRLSLVGRGNDHRAFERGVLAPLIKPGMEVYEQLNRDIFG